MYDYELGTLSVFGVWTDMRTKIGNLKNGILTATCLSAGDAGWIIRIRATRKLTKEEQTWLHGWFAGYTSTI
jgi:hypothetical protein